MITSRLNPKVKLARSLRNKKARDLQGKTLVEGIWHVGEAVAAGAKIDSIFYSPDLLTSDFAFQTVKRAEGSGIPCLAVAPDIFASMTEKSSPQGILALVDRVLTPLESLTPDNFSWGVALVAPQDPGNIGTILRTVDAVGASGLILLDGGADPWHPTAMRAAMGATFWHPLIQASFENFSKWAKTGGYSIIGTSAKGEEKPGNWGQPPFILLLGSEQKGLSDEQISGCDRLVRLPMTGRVRSLNLAVAAGVLMYQIHQQIAPNQA
jgi:TrmH family RNA methyltransferase